MFTRYPLFPQVHYHPSTGTFPVIFIGKPAVSQEQIHPGINSKYEARISIFEFRTLAYLFAWEACPGTMGEIVEKAGQGRAGGVVCADALGATADGICANFPAGPTLRKTLKPNSFLQSAADFKTTANSRKSVVVIRLWGVSLVFQSHRPWISGNKSGMETLWKNIATNNLLHPRFTGWIRWCRSCL
ncbi:MAG: hypothetical protein K9K62_08070 [Desulfobacteraceae bacterium]|nr:hypothetical protein [Desulfobacteraceae bacterium]